MTKEKLASDMSTWFSTYGVLTSKRILDRFNINLNDAELAQVIKDPDNVYHQLLRVPLKNVFNGIILQQAHDYQVYAQKLYVDYLLSGEKEKPEDSPGSETRGDLEQRRKELLEMSESFSRLESDHKKLIATSQSHLKKLASELPADISEVSEATKKSLTSTITTYLEKVQDIENNLRSYRSQFYNTILVTTNLIKLLPDYRPDEAQILENRETLYFDPKIGEEITGNTAQGA